jgi:hypothetical protein
MTARQRRTLRSDDSTITTVMISDGRAVLGAAREDRAISIAEHKLEVDAVVRVARAEPRRPDEVHAPRVEDDGAVLAVRHRHRAVVVLESEREERER